MRRYVVAILLALSVLGTTFSQAAFAQSETVLPEQIERNQAISIAGGALLGAAAVVLFHELNLFALSIDMPWWALAGVGIGAILGDWWYEHDLWPSSAL